MKKKILVIGGAGFIGSNIIEVFLKKKINFDATFYKKKPHIKSKKINYIYLDLKNKKKISNLIKNYRFIIMCGGKIFNSRNKIDILEEFNENVNIHLNVIKAVSEANVYKYLWFSSCTGYPESSKKIEENKFFESEPSFHKLPGWHSRFIEKVLENCSQNFKTKFITIRAPEVYGKYDNYNLDSCRNIPLIIARAITENYKTIKLDINFKKSYIYANDLAKLSLKVLFKSKKNYDVFNICNDETYTIKNITEQIQNILNIKMNVDDNKNRYTKNKNRHFSNLKLKKFLKINKIGDLNKSIKYTINWYSLI